jgi:soluble lytic murein transglycosylase
MEDSTEALRHFESAGASARTRDLSSRAYWRAASLAAELGKPERALENLERIPVRSVIDRVDLLDLKARVHRAQGDSEGEARVLRELFKRAPSTERAVEAVHRLADLEEPTAHDRVAFAEAALRNRHPALAERQALRALAMISRDSDPELEGRARLQYGKALMAQRRLTAARKELDRLPDKTNVEDRAEALLDRARCLWKLGQIDACLAEYDVVADGPYPEEFRGTAAWEAAREAKDNRRWREAALRMKEFQRLYPDHEYADAALWHRGRALVELGEQAEAIESFHRLRHVYEDSPYREEAAYGIAQLHQASGDREEACAEFSGLLRESPDSYWSARTRDILAGEPCPAADSVAAPSPDRDVFEWLAEVLPTVDPRLSAHARRRVAESEPFRRASALAALGLLSEAESELKGLRRALERDEAGLVALADASWRIGVPRSGMRAILQVKARTGKPILSGGMPPRAARLLYPLEHVDSVLQWAQEYDLDPLFVYAVMREESWFDPEAVSWAGARGLLQIMPSTGRDLARRVGLNEFDRADLFKPDVNIRLGTFYLRSLLNELDREPALALSAYNAGKHNALRWRKGIDGDFDVDRYVAGITYNETYNYVQRVTRSWTIYRHLYGRLVPELEKIRNGGGSR